MKLTEEQKSVIKNILKFNKNVQILSGYAGTGKSCVVQHLAQVLDNFAVCAYTGKAADVLRKKGVNAQTIHSLIYKAHQDELTKKVTFSLAHNIDCDGIIVDEASMVSKEIYADLLYFEKPIIFVGDHGQLEPIGDNFNLMTNPDYKLETIHRNAGEIAHFAEFIRNGYRPKAWEYRGGDKIKFLSKSNYKEVLTSVDQTICAYNKTRAEINVLTRELLGRTKDIPQISDKIMCLRNNKNKGLFNGMQGHIGWFETKNIIQFVTSTHSFEVNMDLAHFNKIKYELDLDRDAPDPFDYAYAITCHKAQGDQFDKILVVDQKSDLWDRVRWAYTAATRAENMIYWVEF
jgi:exodeoxyribonuclease-5